ncbi:MAG: ParB/RepB/Spo0J family partition protein [Oscillospiraceae bacterium]|nr:ParB/RepB/Spo0J family partition protein [Oscillospiraceae bacterium]
MERERNTDGRILYLPLRLLKNEGKSRDGSMTSLQELAASIRQVGILQPLTVRKLGESYTVVSGRRRLLAARMAGLGEVPCILLNLDPGEELLISLTENLQREDLNCFQEAELLRAYLKASGLTQEQAAKKLGRSQSAIANKLRLLQHSEKVRGMLTEHGLGERHGRELLRIQGEEARLAVLGEIIARGLSVAQTVSYIDVYLQNHRDSGTVRYQQRDTRLFLQRMARDTEILRAAGVRAELEQERRDGEVVVTLRIGESRDAAAHAAASGEILPAAK